MTRASLLSILKPSHAARALGVALLCALLGSCKPASESNAPAVTLGTYEWPGSYWIDIAINKGWFDEAGIKVKRVDVDLKYFPSLGLVATGGLDAIGFSQFDLVRHVAAGEDLVGVAAIDYSEGAEALVAVAGINNLKDLKGKTLAFHRGTYLDYLLDVFAQREGVDLRTIHIVDRTTDLAFDDFKNGKVDAILAWEPWIRVAKEAGGHVVVSTKDLPGLTYSVLTFRRVFVQQHGEEVAALVSIWHRAERYIHEHPEESCQIVAAAFGEDLNDIKHLLEVDRVLDLADNSRAFSYAAGFESLHGSWRRMNDFMLERGMVDKRVDSPSHLDSSFIRRLH
ncbi:MAG TPA: ABC transporter substrate-binding protein [Steroidobacteraceae bacterium]